MNKKLKRKDTENMEQSQMSMTLGTTGSTMLRQTSRSLSPDSDGEGQFYKSLTRIPYLTGSVSEQSKMVWSSPESSPRPGSPGGPNDSLQKEKKRFQYCQKENKNLLLTGNLGMYYVFALLFDNESCILIFETKVYRIRFEISDD